jgi:hypothetical protein
LRFEVQAWILTDRILVVLGVAVTTVGKADIQVRDMFALFVTFYGRLFTSCNCSHEYAAGLE